jgi:hypothetical protein
MARVEMAVVAVVVVAFERLRGLFASLLLSSLLFVLWLCVRPKRGCAERAVVVM